MNELTAKDCSDIETSIARERLRQARHSFNAALAATAVSACIGLIGAGLLLLGKVSEGTVTALGSAVSCAGCIRLAKDANDRLDNIAQEIMDNG
jgi:CHASE2 domain-containing sensor protein